MILLLFISVANTQLTDLDGQQIRSTSQVRILGRHDLTDKAGVNFYHSGCGVQVNLKGSEIWVCFEVNYTNKEPWVVVQERNNPISRFQLQKGVVWYQVLQGLDANSVHDIKITRDVQALPGYNIWCHLVGLRFSGSLENVPDPRYKIEFIGDSLTSAMGAAGIPGDDGWYPGHFSQVYSYSHVAATALGAEERVFALSGWGYLSGGGNNIHENMYDTYEQVCGMIPNNGHGSDELVDFNNWKANIVVNFLGTNDHGAMNAATGWTDPTTGIVYKQDANNTKPLEDRMYDFLVKVRKYNPTATLVTMFFENDNVILPLLKNAVARFRANVDTSCEWITVPGVKNDGGGGHPSANDHRNIAAALVPQLQAILDGHRELDL